MALIPSYSSGGIVSGGSGGPNPLPSEFAGIGLAPGVVRGARSFKVDNLGRLTGVVHEQVWRPGENLSECRKNDDSVFYFTYATRSYAGQMNAYINAINQTAVTATVPVTYLPALPPDNHRKKRRGKSVTTVPVTKPERPATAPAPEPKAHTMGECACGFYGYYDGSDDYYKDGYVSGVIEGYGEALIGTRGFRVEKARIVALMIPAAQDRFANRIARNYSGIPLFARFAEMVAAFPPDGTEVGISPENGDEFWTRQA